MSLEAKQLDLKVCDLFGRELQEGDEIFVGLKGPVLFRIVSIRPNMDPRQSPNLVFVELAAMAAFSCQREAKNQEFIRVRTAEEAGPPPWTKVGKPEGQA